jgi:hypothetical protein
VSRAEAVRRSPWPALAGAALAVLLLGDAGPAAAQNRIANPHFHDDELGWQFGPGTDLVWSPTPDESDCPTSGSGIVISQNTGNGHHATLSQCVALGDESELHVRLHHRAYGTLTARLDFFTASNCAAGALGGVSDSWAGTPTEWSIATLAADVPGNAGAVRLIVTAIDSAPHGLVVDAVHLTPLEPVFLDGFEGDDPAASAPCRWASP